MERSLVRFLIGAHNSYRRLDPQLGYVLEATDRCFSLTAVFSLSPSSSFYKSNEIISSGEDFLKKYTDIRTVTTLKYTVPYHMKKDIKMETLDGISVSPYICE